MSRIGTTNIKMSDIRTELRTNSIGATNVKLTDYYRNPNNDQVARTKETGLANSYRYISSNPDFYFELPPGNVGSFTNTNYARTVQIYRINGTAYDGAPVVNADFPMTRTWKWNSFSHTETYTTAAAGDPGSNKSYGPSYGSTDNTNTQPWQGFAGYWSGEYHYNTPVGNDMSSRTWPSYTPGDGAGPANAEYISYWKISSTSVAGPNYGWFPTKLWTNIYAIARTKGTSAYNYPYPNGTLNANVPAKPATGNTEISYSNFINASNSNTQ